MDLLYNLAICGGIPLGLWYLSSLYNKVARCRHFERRGAPAGPDAITQDIADGINENLEKFLSREPFPDIGDIGADFDIPSLVEAKIERRARGTIKRDIFEIEETKRRECLVTINFTTAKQDGYICTQPYTAALAKGLLLAVESLDYKTAVHALGKDVTIIKGPDDTPDFSGFGKIQPEPVLNLHQCLEALALFEEAYGTHDMLHFVIVNGQSPISDTRLKTGTIKPVSKTVYYEIKPHGEGALRMCPDNMLYGDAGPDNTEALISGFNDFLYSHMEK